MKTLNRYILILLLASALVSAWMSGSTDTAPNRGTAAATKGAAPRIESGKLSGRAGNHDVTEKELTQARLDAFQAAQARGALAAAQSTTRNPAKGWNGEQLLNSKTNDWEPAIAADPNAPYVYLLTTRYGKPRTCPKHCPTPYLVLTISKDGGKSWGPQIPLCRCHGAQAQYDPTIEVVPGTGTVYSTFLITDKAGGLVTRFIKSSDHAQTWTKPVPIYGHVAWTDKPEITTNTSGRNVYVSWNGPRGGDLYVSTSHNYGKSWAHHKLSNSKRYFYAYDGTVLPTGTVVFSESSVTYGSGRTVVGPIWHRAIISRDQGNTWRNVVVDRVANGRRCLAKKCPGDYYTGQTSVASDSAGNLAFAYEGATRNGGLQRVYVRTSTDQGRTWSRRVVLSAKGENATQPRIDFAGPGEARIWYMQTSGGGNDDVWNARFRSSSDGGKTWRSSVRLSNAVSGPGYVSPKGFKEIYGDYGEIAVTNRAKTIAVWGEGFGYIGPGGTWFALQK